MHALLSKAKIRVWTSVTLIWADCIMLLSLHYHTIMWTCTSWISQWSTQLSQKHQSYHAIISYDHDDPANWMPTKHIVCATSQPVPWNRTTFYWDNKSLATFWREDIHQAVVIHELHSRPWWFLSPDPISHRPSVSTDRTDRDSGYQQHGNYPSIPPMGLV